MLLLDADGEPIAEVLKQVRRQGMSTTKRPPRSSGGNPIQNEHSLQFVICIFFRECRVERRAGFDAESRQPSWGSYDSNTRNNYVIL